MHPRSFLSFTRNVADPGGRVQRTTLLLAIGLAHLLAILWLATRPAVQSPRPQSQAAGKLIALSEQTVADLSPPVPVPVPEIELPPPVLTLPDVLQQPLALAEAAPPTAASGPGQAGAVCALAADIGQAVVRDSGAMAELAALPQSLRTTADAVMLWDGGWVEASGVARPTQPGALRSAVAGAIMAASPDCRDAAVLGPQLIPIPEATRTTMIVVGSGAWRWSDLVGPEACSIDAPSLCLAPVPPPRPTASRPQTNK